MSYKPSCMPYELWYCKNGFIVEVRCFMCAVFNNFYTQHCFQKYVLFNAIWYPFRKWTSFYVILYGCNWLMCYLKWDFPCLHVVCLFLFPFYVFFVELVLRFPSSWREASDITPNVLRHFLLIVYAVIMPSEPWSKQSNTEKNQFLPHKEKHNVPLQAPANWLRLPITDYTDPSGRAFCGVGLRPLAC
jgi:hypothetical protein